MSTTSYNSNDSSYKDGYGHGIISAPSLGDEEYGTVKSVEKTEMSDNERERIDDTEKPSCDDANANQEQVNKVNSLCADLSCLCVPFCAKNPNDISSRLSKWFLGNSDQFLSSMIVAISMIPEAISYAIIAGLPPSFALQSCWISCMMTAVIGGRPGMITSASGLSAMLLCRLVNTDTVGALSIMFVPFVVGFAGILQTVCSFFGFAKLASNLPLPLVVGMVNGLALLAFALQIRYVKLFPLNDADMGIGTAAAGSSKAVETDWIIPLFSYSGRGIDWIQPWASFGVYITEVFLAFIITMFVPKLTTFFPAHLMAILVIVAMEFGLARQFGADTPLIMDYGGAEVKYPWTTVLNPEYTLPSLASWETWKIVTGYGSALFATQFIETAVSLNVVNRLDDSDGAGFLVLFGHGISNTLIGFMGGMGASGVVSMSVLADRTFGTTCLSTFMTGALLFIFTAWAFPVINYIPLSAISGISIATTCSFIQWRSLFAVFTSFLPNSMRQLLPAQFNIDRLDVSIMLIATTVCLILDVSALLLFLIGVIVSIALVCRERPQKDQEENQDNIAHFIEEAEKNDEVNVETVKKQQSFDHPSPSRSFDRNSERDGCTVVDLMCDAAEHAIFPVVACT